jgi:ribosome-binding factor A
MVSKLRAQRIADRIHEELSLILLLEAGDPRLMNISITKIRVDRELAFASIYVSSLEGKERATDILDGLEHARGYLRSELASRIPLRTFPRLRFYWDTSPAHADKIERLIASLHADDSPSEEDDESETDE